MNDLSTQEDNSWNSLLYDDSHSFVYEHGEELLELLAPEEGESILDLGCGTGHLTQQIAECGAEVLGIDNSREMLVQARAEYPDLHIVQADARQVYVSSSFDAVFSNAVLHWILPPEAVIKCVRDALGDSGRFVAECGGKGNVETIVSEIISVIREAGYEPHNPWYFPTIPEYTALLQRHGLEPRYARLFDRPTRLDGEAGLHNWIAMFTDSFFAEIPASEQKELIKTIETRLYDDLYDSQDEVWIADYRRLRVEAHVERG